MARNLRLSIDRHKKLTVFEMVLPGALRSKVKSLSTLKTVQPHSKKIISWDQINRQFKFAAIYIQAVWFPHACRLKSSKSWTIELGH